MTRFWSKAFDWLDDVAAYALTIVGILLSAYAPMLKTIGRIDLAFDPWRLLISAAVAVMVVGKSEALSPDEVGNTEKARAGRRRKFGQRMANAVGQGMMWAQLVQLSA